MRTFQSLLVAASLLAGVPAHAFEPMGEVIFTGPGQTSGVSFDEERLVGPMITLTRRDDGGWSGQLAGANLNLTRDGNRLYGPNVTLVFEKDDQGTVKVQGQWYGQRLRLDLDAKKAHGRFGTCSVDFQQKAPGYYYGDVGCFHGKMPSTGRASLKLLGAAANASALPQLALALLAVLPSEGVTDASPGAAPGFREN